SCPGDRLYAWVRQGAPRPGGSPSTGGLEGDEMGQYVNVGINAAQDLPPNTWRTIEWGKEYSDNHHHHWDKGGSSVVTGPAKYAVRASVRITGLPPGTEGQIRITGVNAEDGSEREPGPIQEFTASAGDTFVLYANPIERVGKGHKARVEIIQYGTETARIVSGNLKANVYPE
ncbi:hypothetical protein ACFQ07_19730, partial [Actinomadura adrarensis]